MSAGYTVSRSYAQEPALPAKGNDQPYVVDVRQFGAKGDGVTNDAPAINRAIEHIRISGVKVGGFDVCPRLLLPSAVYAVTESINLTQLQAINMVLEGDGSLIVGKCRGEPVVDAVGSRWLMIRDLTIIGDKSEVPKLGVQIGRIANGKVADNHRFENVKVLGSYSLACLLNLSAETSGFDHVLLWNAFPSSRSYCLIQDGLNHFDAKSKFVPNMSLKVEQDDSFNENEFINCDFRHGGGGIPVWLGDTYRQSFIRCYAATDGEVAFVVYCGPNNNTMLDVDCHCETGYLKTVFLITGSRASPTIQGFSYKDHVTHASRTILQADTNVKKVTLRDANIEIAYYRNSSCRVFDDPAKWKVTGRYSSRSDREWNAANIFAGETFMGDSFNVVGNVSQKIASGVSAERPMGLSRNDSGHLYFDKSLNKIVVWSGSEWLDSNGQKV